MKHITNIYNSIRILFDPATEGTPHVRLIRRHTQAKHIHMSYRLHRKIIPR